MKGAQFFKSPSGDETVILARAEYDAIVAALDEAAEDAADLAVARARKEDLQAGRDAVLPAEVSRELLRGRSLVAAVRKWRRVRQTELATRSGLSQGYISDIESRRRKGSPDALAALAEALEAPTDWLVDLTGRDF